MILAPAIERNRVALIALVASIAALIGGRDGAIARALRNAALALLRPAESAARRLIVAAARGLVARPGAPFPRGLVVGAGEDAGRVPAFRLFDRLKRFGEPRRPLPPGKVPRIRTFWGAADAAAPSPAPRRTSPDAPVESRPLRRRLRALEAALADLPRQARRLARWRARRAAGPRASFRSPLRPGRPPGWRNAGDREIDRLLTQCHALAREALCADTS